MRTEDFNNYIAAFVGVLEGRLHAARRAIDELEANIANAGGSPDLIEHVMRNQVSGVFLCGGERILLCYDCYGWMQTSVDDKEVKEWAKRGSTSESLL